jgi:hypothetical protein
VQVRLARDETLQVETVEQFMHSMIDREPHFVLRRFRVCELHRVNIAENGLNRPANCGLLSTHSWYFVFPRHRRLPVPTIRDRAGSAPRKRDGGSYFGVRKEKP